MRALKLLLIALSLNNVSSRNYENYESDDFLLIEKDKDNFLLSNTSTLFQAPTEAPKNKHSFLRGPR